LGLYCGTDWVSDHHDIAVVDDDGRVVVRGRVGNDAAGFAQLLMLLAEAGDSREYPTLVAIETDRGLWVAAPRETGRVIYPINSLTASRYRARYAVSGAKSHATDAVLLANIVCTDRDAHRPLPADTELAQAIRVLARAPQDAVWAHSRSATRYASCSKTSIRPRSWRSPSCPAGGWPARCPHHPGRCADPAQAAKLSPTRLRRPLVKAGRRRDLDRDVDRLRAVFTDTYLHQPPVVENAMGIQLSALLRQFAAACAATVELAEAAIAHFERHPNAAIITS
jgi:Transposase